jgi:hypothetical protein
MSNKLLSVVIFILLFLSDSCGEIAILQSVDWSIVTNLGSLFLFILVLLSSVNKKLPGITSFGRSIFWFAVALVVSFFLSSVRLFGQDKKLIINCLLRYGGLSLYFIFLQFSNKRLPDVLHSTLRFYGLVFSIYVILLAFPFGFEKLVDPSRFEIRYGLCRVKVFSPCVCYLMLSSYINVRAKRKIIVNILLLAVTIYAVVFVWIIRQQIASLVFTFFLIRFTDLKRGRKKLIIPVLLFIIILNGVYLASDYIGTRFDLGDENTLAPRALSFVFYSRIFLETKLLGFGRVSTSPGAPENAILDAYKNNLFSVDLGLIGYTFQYGILLIVSIILFYKSFFTETDPPNPVLGVTTIGLSLVGYILYTLFSVGTQSLYYDPYQTIFYSCIMYLSNKRIISTNPV